MKPWMFVVTVCKDHDKSPKIPKNDFCKLNIATKESFFMFSKKFYKQIHSVVMGPPLGLAQANIFICCFESKWLKDCPLGLKPLFCSWCVDVLFDLIYITFNIYFVFISKKIHNK